LKLIGFLLPSLLTLSIPMAILTGSLICFGRLSNDNELTAIRSSGISLYRVLLPVISATLLLCLCLIPLNNNIAPELLYKFRHQYYKLMYKNPLVKLEEHTFINISDYKIYVEKIKQAKSGLSGIIIYRMEKEKLPTLITALEGRIENRNNSIILHLFNGQIRQRDREDYSKYNILEFNTYDILLASPNSMPDVSKRIKEMNMKELKAEMNLMKKRGLKLSSILIEIHQRLSFSFSGFVFCLLGAPLGIQTHSRGKSVGFGLSLMLAFLYYFVMAIGITLSDKNVVSPFFGMWLPNLTFGIVGSLLILRIVKK